MQPILGRTRTLFLGRDLLINWELAGTPVDQPDPEAEGYLYQPIRPEKAWKPGQPMDFDSVPASVFDQYRYVITLRDPAGSEPLPNMRLVRTTRFYQLWERVGATQERKILPEGESASALLDCKTPQGRAIASSAGTASVRTPESVTPLPVIAPGQTYKAGVSLTPGRWALTEPYISYYPIDVSAPGLHTTLPANLDYPGPGPRWFVGDIDVKSKTPVIFTFHAHSAPFAPKVPIGLYMLVATSAAGNRVTALRQACGHYVDWYRTS